MSEEKKYTLDAAHHFFGVEFNNAIFGFAEKASLTDVEKEEMIQTAHAAVLHWQKFSKATIANSQRGYYMLAKAYVKAGEKKNELKYANLCYDISTKNPSELLDWDFAYAYEMKARTAAMHNDKENFDKFYTMAKEQEAMIKDPEDLKYFSMDFKSGDWFNFVKNK